MLKELPFTIDYRMERETIVAVLASSHHHSHLGVHNMMAVYAEELTLIEFSLYLFPFPSTHLIPAHFLIVQVVECQGCVMLVISALYALSSFVRNGPELELSLL